MEDIYYWFSCSLMQILPSETKNGILDMKWNSQAILAVALSNGEVTFLQLSTKSV
jgi:hypothetical protein